jgi:hypothetical protein
VVSSVVEDQPSSSPCEGHALPRAILDCVDQKCNPGVLHDVDVVVNNDSEAADPAPETDFSSFPDDIADCLNIFDTVENVDKPSCGSSSMAYEFSSLPDDIAIDDEFYLPSIDDVNEELFLNEASVEASASRDNNVDLTSVTVSGCFENATVEEMEAVRKGGVRRSEASEKWAARAFDDWREFRGFSIEKSIGDLFEEADLKPFVDMLVRFVLEVKKKDGQLYHPTT